ncbi:MAG: hypothetical protein M0P31_17010 [Solirubrobacteraceae bacterium]|nr:hypothetical protein [Solirubrobacteraceae bacterium]
MKNASTLLFMVAAVALGVRAGVDGDWLAGIALTCSFLALLFFRAGSTDE